MHSAQQVSGHWKQLRRRIWPARMRACCARPDQDRAVEDENLRGARPARPFRSARNRNLHEHAVLLDAT